MNSDSIFSPRLLVVWIVGAVLVFVVTLYFMGSEDQGHQHGRAQHVLAFGHRLCRHRRSDAAARHYRDQEPLRFAQQGHGRKASW